MEKKDYCKVVLYSFLAVSLAACGDAENIVGKWVQPVPGLPEMQQGFVLKREERLLPSIWRHSSMRLGNIMGNRLFFPEKAWEIIRLLNFQIR